MSHDYRKLVREIVSTYAAELPPFALDELEAVALEAAYRASEHASDDQDSYVAASVWRASKRHRQQETAYAQRWIATDWEILDDLCTSPPDESAVILEEVEAACRDETDRRIIDAMYAAPYLSHAAVAREVGLSKSTIGRRLKSIAAKLRRRGNLA